MRVERLVLGELQTNSWVVSDDRGGPAVVIDPAGGPPDAGLVIEALGGRQVALVILTHAHFDHLGSAGAVLAETGAPLVAHAIDAPRITSAAADGTGGALFGFSDIAPAADRVVHDHQHIAIGRLDLEVIHTPGHTAGSISLLASDDSGGPARLFSGDTLFANSVGRTDFPGGDASALRASIARLAALPDDTLVHPGHGPDTTIGRERRVNPFFPRA